MSRRSSSPGGKASEYQHLERLFNLYDVQRNKRVCPTDFEFVHSLAQQFMDGRTCDLHPAMNTSDPRSLRMAAGGKDKKGDGGKPCVLPQNTSNHRSLRIAGGSQDKKGDGGKPCVLPQLAVQGSLSEEYGKEAFSNVDLDSDGCISWHDFHGWVTALMDRMCKCSGHDRRHSFILIQHVTHMLQTDKRLLAYRSIVLSAKRTAEQDDSRQLFAAIAASQKALGSAEAIIKHDVLAGFQHQLTVRKQDLKRELFTALAAAQTLQTRESALREVMEAKGLLLLEPIELTELSQYRHMVKASRQPFTVHVSTLAGPDAYVEVSHEDLVWDLRVKVHAELKQGPHVYQTMLSNMRGTLDNDSAKLRECLLCLSEGEEMVATYVKADRWVELSHAEFKELRCKESKAVACLYQAAEEAEKKARCHKSEGNIMKAMVLKAEAYCHKTWQEATFEDILIEAAVAFGREYGSDAHWKRRLLKKLKKRGLVEM